MKEERFATPQDKELWLRAIFKKSVIKIIIKIQAYQIY